MHVSYITVHACQAVNAVSYSTVLCMHVKHSMMSVIEL